jgi:pimeloyl-ACP methyl ester carboxylesterase
MIAQRVIAASLLLTAILLRGVVSGRAQTVAPPIATPGRMIDIGGWRLHLNCSGVRRPSQPIVVLEADSADFSVGWSLLQPDVARFARVCSYDRSGLGWSEPGPSPRTFRQIVWELDTLLQKAGETGPFIVVGNGYGALWARLFAFTHQQEIKGMVLVDSVHEEDIRDVRDGKLTRLTDAASQRPIPPAKSSLSDLERGPSPARRSQIEATIRQMAPLALEPPYDRLPPDAQRMRTWSWSRVDHWAASNDNPFLAEELASLLAFETAPVPAFGDRPLIVLSAAAGAKGDEYVAHQERLRGLSTKGKRIVANTPQRAIMLTEPSLVIMTIREVLDSTRN